jgi:hypothetical protein
LPLNCRRQCGRTSGARSNNCSAKSLPTSGRTTRFGGVVRVRALAPDVVRYRPDAGRRPRDIGAWKCYFSAESDGSLIREKHEAWHKEKPNKRLVYHKLLIEAAEALLSVDFRKYGNPYWTTVDESFCLNKTFLLQVYDVDQSFRFNYCEYVLARRLEPIPQAKRSES